MSTDEDSKIEAISRICEIAWLNFDRRRSYEWKFSIAIWTSIAAFIALTLQGKISPTPPKPAFWFVAFLIWILQIIFQIFVKLSNRVDQKKALKYEELLNHAIGQEFEDTRGKILKFTRGWWSFIIQICVTLILIISAGFAIYKNTKTSGETVMSGTAYIFNIIMAIAALASAIFAAFVCLIVKKTLIHQALLDIHRDYRSHQIQYAIGILWQFYEDNKKTFVDKYDKIRSEEKEWISRLDKQQRIEAQKVTLHYQRKLVTDFYQHLANLYLNRVLPKKMIYKAWTEADLRIIPEVLIPIENKLREVLHGLGPIEEDCELLILYRGSKNR